MRRTWTLIGAMAWAATFQVAATAQGAVLCRSRSGAVRWRDPACRRKEIQIDVAELGIIGPVGPSGARGAPAIVQVTDLHFTGENSAPPGSDYALLRSLGTFTKAEDGTSVKLTLNANTVTTGLPGQFCQWELRVDGNDSQGSSSTTPTGAARGNAVVYASVAIAYGNVSATAYFNGLAFGDHTVSIWLSGNATDCKFGSGNFGQDLIVEELNV